MRPTSPTFSKLLRLFNPANKTTRSPCLRTLHRKVIPPKLCIKKYLQKILLQLILERRLCTGLESLMIPRCSTRRGRMWIFPPSRRACMFLICVHLSMLSTSSQRASDGRKYSYANTRPALEVSKNGTIFSIT